LDLDGKEASEAAEPTSSSVASCSSSSENSSANAQKREPSGPSSLDRGERDEHPPAAPLARPAAGRFPASPSASREHSETVIFFLDITIIKITKDVINLKPPVLESDNVVAVAAINSPLPNNSANWHVYSNIKRLRDVLPGCAIFRIGKKGNGVAHDLAKMARRSGVSSAWLTPIPTVISDLCK
jgi:hypothetical protein